MSTSLGWEGNRIGLASHWPCVTDSGLPTYSSTAYVKEMSTLPTLLLGYGIPFPFSGTDMHSSL